MGRTYAGILGPLAMMVVIAKGFHHAEGVESILWTGMWAVGAFAVVGFVLGELAAWIVEDSVRTKVATELAALEASQASRKKK